MDLLDISVEDTEIIKYFKCPICKLKFKNRYALLDHVAKSHGDMIPENTSPAKFLFDIRHPNSQHLCTQCRVAKVTFNEETMKYNRFCSNKCKEEYVKIMKERMINKYGKPHLLDEPLKQQEMLNNRKISKEYIFSSGGSIITNSSYEYNFLKFLDIELSFTIDEITRCPFFFEYEYEGSKKIYIPDFWLPNYNLIVEIKDGGDNPNMHHKIQSVDKNKEKIKDNIMKNQTKYNYIKVVNNEFGKFISMLNMIRDMNIIDDSNNVIVII